jgi:hypothetical protein
MDNADLLMLNGLVEEFLLSIESAQNGPVARSNPLKNALLLKATYDFHAITEVFAEAALKEMREMEGAVGE